QTGHGPGPRDRAPMLGALEQEKPRRGGRSRQAKSTAPPHKSGKPPATGSHRGCRRARRSPADSRMVQAGASEAMTGMPLDHSVYPDLAELPAVLESLESKADYVHRICSAWDYGIHPDPETFALFSRWKEVFDHHPVVTSPAYHAFRAWFGWEPLPFPAG